MRLISLVVDSEGSEPAACPSDIARSLRRVCPSLGFHRRTRLSPIRNMDRYSHCSSVSLTSTPRGPLVQLVGRTFACKRRCSEQGDALERTDSH